MYFSIIEFTQEELIPAHVVAKIEQFHIPTLNKCREVLKQPIIISQRSGYRSIMTEQANGRSGRSQHTFQGKGAVDLTASDLNKLGLVLKQFSDYSRICYYPTKRFYHCDYKPSSHRLYLCADGVNWTREGF